MKIYLSHSVGCAGWNIFSILQDTHFNHGCRTLRYREVKDDSVKMLDWDYLQWQKFPEKVKSTHLRLVQEHEFDVVMSMDFWGWNRIECLNYTDELLKYTDRVLILVHSYSPELKDYELAYPNANWFTTNKFVPYEYRDNITHLLGGSPHAQMEKITTTQLDLYGHPVRFQNIHSVDGNQIFNVAIKSGKIWRADKPHWIKPDPELPNETVFRKSVENVERYWNPT